MFLGLSEIISPAYVYWLNKTNVIWEGSNWFTSFVKYFFIFTPVILLIQFYKNSFFSFIKHFVSLIYAYIFIRVFFLPINFGLLDGNEINHSTVLSDNSFYTTLGLCCFILLVSIKKYKIIQNFIQFSFIATSFFTAYLYYINSTEIKKDSTSFAKFSKNTNVLIFSFDSLQNDILNEVISANKANKKLFNDFTYYTDVVGYAPNTGFSLLSTLTGKYLKVGEDGIHITQLRKQLKEFSLAKIMSNNGYETSTYNVPCILAIDSNCHRTSSVLPKNVATKFQFSAKDIFLLKTIPKSFSWDVLNFFNFSQVSKIDHINEIIDDKSNHGFSIDKYVFEKLYKNIMLIKKPVFKFYHFLHSHQPIRFDEIGNYNKLTDQTMDNAKLEIEFVIKEFNKLLIQLKKMEIYNDALIIFTSDHGYMTNLNRTYKTDKFYYNGLTTNKNGLWPASRYWPVLLVKYPKQQSEKVVFNHKPVELVDIFPTIMDTYNISYESNQIDGNSLLIKKESSRSSMIFIGGKSKKFHTEASLFKKININENSYNGIPRAMKNIKIGE